MMCCDKVKVFLMTVFITCSNISELVNRTTFFFLQSACNYISFNRLNKQCLSEWTLEDAEKVVNLSELERPKSEFWKNKINTHKNRKKKVLEKLAELIIVHWVLPLWSFLFCWVSFYNMWLYRPTALTTTTMEVSILLFPSQLKCDITTSSGILTSEVHHKSHLRVSMSRWMMLSGYTSAPSCCTPPVELLLPDILADGQTDRLLILKLWTPFLNISLLKSI